MSGEGGVQVRRSESGSVWRSLITETCAIVKESIAPKE